MEGEDASRERHSGLMSMHCPARGPGKAEAAGRGARADVGAQVPREVTSGFVAYRLCDVV